MKKNIAYVLMVVLFASGGIIALANNADRETIEPRVSATAEPWPSEYNGTETTPQLSPSNINLRRETDSFVGIVQSAKENATDLTFEDIRAMVREAVALAGGLEGIVNDGDTVVLKPNIVTIRCNTLPGWNGRRLPAEVNGNSTDYRVTRAVAQMVRELNPSGLIYVMEGSTGNTAEFFRAMNYTREHIPEVDEFFAIETDSGTWGDRNSNGLIRVSLEGALLHSEYYFNRRLYEADVLISLPTLKNHWDAVVTGSIKNIAIGVTPANIYGNSATDSLRNNMVNHFTPDLHKWIADYYTLRPADFVVMDGLQGLQHGPTPSYEISGITNFAAAQMNMRVIMASADSLANDIVQTNIINWDMDSVRYLQHLIEAERVGNGNTQNITVLGVMVDDIRTDFDGVVPATGGRRITRPTPPQISIQSAAFNGGNLRMQLTLSNDTDKLDIYINGSYVTSVSENMTDFSLNLQTLPDGNHEIIVYAYDRYMHNASASVNARK